MLKLLFDPQSGRVLGAQAVGGAGVDKRIDVLAVAIQAGMTVFDLEEMELAYSPQYGSAKDPVNMAGFVAAGLLRGDHPQLDAEAVAADPKQLPSSETPLLLDVRTPSEFTAGAMPGAVNVPLDELRRRAGGTAPRSPDRRLLPGRTAGLSGDPHPAAGRIPGRQRRRRHEDVSPVSSAGGCRPGGLIRAS